MKVSIITGSYNIYRYPPKAEIPENIISAQGFLSITRTEEELSIVCNASVLLPDSHCEAEWSLLKLEGPIDFSLTGVVANLTRPLAENGVGVFVISTYDTDYILVKEKQLGIAIEAWKESGYEIV